MSPAAVAFLAVLLVFSAQGQSRDGSNKCKCSNDFLTKVNRKLIKEGPFVHLPDVYCPRTEITITTTANKKKCVNPESPFGKAVLEKVNKLEAKEAVSTTAASSPTSLHVTSGTRDSTLQRRRLH